MPSVLSMPMKTFDRTELRCVVGIQLLGLLYQKGKMQQKAQWQFFYDNFHGNTDRDIASQLVRFMQIEGVYAALFEPRPNTVVDPADTGAQRIVYVLRQTLQRNGQTLIVGRHITKELMERTSIKQHSALVSGRPLFDASMEALRHMKQANAFALPLVNNDGEPMVSGDSIEDVYNKVLDKMYNHQKNKEKGITCDEDDDDENAEGCQRPEGWRFKGWMAWVLFGCTAPKERQIDLLSLTNPAGDQSSNSRKALRLKEAKEREAERSIAAASEIGAARGLSMGESIAIGNMDIRKRERKDKQDMRRREMRVISIIKLLEIYERKIRSAEEKGHTELMERFVEKEHQLQTELDELTAAPLSSNGNDDDACLSDRLINMASKPPTAAQPQPKRPRKSLSTCSSLSVGEGTTDDSASSVAVGEEAVAEEASAAVVSNTD